MTKQRTENTQREFLSNVVTVTDPSGGRRVAGSGESRRGVALIMVLVLIVMISLAAYTFAGKMAAQERGTEMAARRVQAEAAVASGVEYIKDYLSMLPEDRAAVGGHWDNVYFKDVAVSDSTDGDFIRFSIVSVLQDQYGEPTAWRFGLTDEGSKININTIATSDLYKLPESEEDAGGGEGDDEGEGEGDEEDGEGGGDEGGGEGGGPEPPDEGEPAPERGGPAEDAAVGGRGVDDLSDDIVVDPAQNVLMQLPGMTETIADSILDWIDEDDETRPAGAEADVYSAVAGYEPTNGPISSLDELLLVQGVTMELLYGADRNHNGLIDEGEVEAAAALGGVESSMARGWSAYLTVSSKDYLEQAEETIDINGDDLEALYDDLIAAGFEEDLSAYIVAFRQNGAFEAEIPEDPEEDFELPVPESISGLQPSFSGGDGQFSSVLDIIGTSTEAQFEGEQDKILVASPYGEDSDLNSIMPLLMSTLVAGESEGTGRINANHCSSSVLSGLPDIEFATVQNILLSQDPGGTSGDLNYLYPTWPLAVGAATLDEMKALLPYVSGTGSVYRAQVIGYSDVPGVYARAEVVIDASGDVPKLLSWRDLSHLGAGFNVETLTAE